MSYVSFLFYTYRDLFNLKFFLFICPDMTAQRQNFKDIWINFRINQPAPGCFLVIKTTYIFFLVWTTVLTTKKKLQIFKTISLPVKINSRSQLRKNFFLDV